jgi:peptide/nickel transport system ATP-binding protein
MKMARTVLSVRDLTISFPGARPVVTGVSFDLKAGEVLAIAGQSGSGKSLTGLAIMGLLPDHARVSGSIVYNGLELVNAKEAVAATVRGAEIAMVFQETITALNPVLTIGKQLVGAIRAHQDITKADALARAASALRDVNIHDTERVMTSYPHQLSGGMCQRTIIAMALACGSHILIADEPTTALDVSVQRGILALLAQLVREKSMACIFVSHDLGVLEEVADNVIVMHSGEIVEHGPIRDTIADPLHPYTKDLLSFLTPLTAEPTPMPDDPTRDIVGTQTEATDACRYAASCRWRYPDCAKHPELLTITPGRQVRCWLYDGQNSSTDRSLEAGAVR